MADNNLIQDILKDVFPEEYKALGPETVKEIIAGVSIVDPDEGNKFPLMEIAEFIKESVEFLAASVAIYAAVPRGSAKSQTQR